MSRSLQAPSLVLVGHSPRNSHPNFEILAPLLIDDRPIYCKNSGLLVDPMVTWSSSMLANAYFFSHLSYGDKYFQTENRSDFFIDRWQAAIGTLDDKVVIDVGCGPGNLQAALKGKPKVLIGTDISEGALLHAQQLGYVPVLADAQDLPLIDRCADVVMLNAVMHHSDDYEAVLREAARLVKPGGILITDMDPQKGAWDFVGLGHLLYTIRYSWYKFTGSTSYKTQEEHILRLATEVHNQQPGSGIDVSVYDQVLEPMGFDYQVCPHNHFVGREVLNGQVGHAPLRFRLGQALSGITPGTREAGLSIMCVAHLPC